MHPAVMDMLGSAMAHERRRSAAVRRRVSRATATSRRPGRLHALLTRALAAGWAGRRAMPAGRPLYLDPSPGCRDA